ncbi:MAG: hypothetical protein O3A46_01645 [Candidatus Poribacteria bacterium]|nr:hypothetical protein [Candidatus Poribacteria bacterium]
MVFVDRQLTEKIVLRVVDDARRRGDHPMSDEYHDATVNFYDLPKRDRASAFDTLHRDMFDRFGFPSLVKELLDDFPILREQVGSVLIGSASSGKDESVDLDTGVNHTDRKRRIGMRLQPERFIDLIRLRQRLRVEWLQLQDTIDPTFQYDTSQRWDDLPPMEQNILRDRYGALWNIAVEGRLARQFGENERARMNLLDQFNRLYRKHPDNVRDVVFQRLWDEGVTPHPSLVALTENRRAFGEFYSGRSVESLSDEREQDISEEIVPNVGDPCPLCRFPTYRWVIRAATLNGEGAKTVGVGEIFERIQAEHPNWKPEYGVCERCYERYELLSTVPPQSERAQQCR